jgi:hypothetical protein
MARFDKFFNAATKSGKKVLGSIHPELKAASTKDKFVLNPVAQKLLGVKPGVDRIMLFDNVKDATSNNDRFFICKGGVDVHGIKHGSLLGKNGVFSYSEVWSAFHMNDLAVTAARPDDMVAKGIVIETPIVPAFEEDGVTPKLDKKKKQVMTGGSYIANQLVLGKLEIGLDEGEEMRDAEVEEGLYSDIYAVTALRFVAHDPQIGDDEDVDIDAVDTNEEATPVTKKGKKAAEEAAE